MLCCRYRSPDKTVTSPTTSGAFYCLSCSWAGLLRRGETEEQSFADWVLIPSPGFHQNLLRSPPEPCTGVHQEGCDLEGVEGQHLRLSYSLLNNHGPLSKPHRPGNRCRRHAHAEPRLHGNGTPAKGCLPAHDHRSHAQWPSGLPSRHRQSLLLSREKPSITVDSEAPSVSGSEDSASARPYRSLT